MNRNLVFDIGAHKGDDAYVYLQLGYRVLSVEANTELISGLKHRFKTEVENNRLTIVNAAVGLTDEGNADLHIHADTSKSSVLANASHKKIRVPCRSLHSLLQEFGLPLYCKIDIEGADLAALQSLQAGNIPKYISVEISGACINELANDKAKLFATLHQLHYLGYSKFILVDQERLQVIKKSSFYRQNLRLYNRINYKLQKLFSMEDRGLFLKRFGLPGEAEVSGLPGTMLNEGWMNYASMQKCIAFHFEEYSSVAKDRSLLFWVDLHATF